VTARARKDSRRAGVNDRARKALRLDLIPNADVGEMVKRAREAGKRRAAK
jgi:hypothetical protein